MSDNSYSVSSTPMSELEEVWLASRKGTAKHLQVHQCLTAFFDILGTGRSNERKDKSSQKSLEPLFEEIGKRLGLAPNTVRESLQEAARKEGGILHVSAPLAIAVGAELQQKLLELFPKASSHVSESAPKPSLRVIVGEVKNRYIPQKEDRVNAVAEAAADYFVNVVPEKCLADENKSPYTSGWIGVSGGNTMLQVVQRIDAAKRGQYEGLTIIPLAGEAEPEEFRISANTVVLRLAEVCISGKAETCSLMTTPIVAQEGAPIDKLRIAQEHSPGVKRVIEHARHVKFAFTGIGSVGRNSRIEKSARRDLTEDDTRKDALSRLAIYCGMEDKPIPEKVVGDICYRPIDAYGKDAWPELSRRLVGPTLEDLKAMSATLERRVFAVACGTEKVAPIIAAFRGGLVNGLITDELTALEILNHP